MCRTLWLLLAALCWPNSGFAQCQFFKIHPGVFEHLRGTGPCRGAVLYRDTDGDESPDWMYAEHFGNVWLPADFDIDGDGVENVRDPHVFRADPDDQLALIGFPAHLHASDTRAQQMQHQIAETYGILVVPYSAQPTYELLANVESALAEVHTLVTQSQLKRLRYIYITAEKHRPSAAAYYLEPAESILLPNDTDISVQELKQTLWHEVGHAVVFSYLTPGRLAKLSRTAGWSAPQEPSSFYDTNLLSPFFGEASAPDAFPTRYAMRNIHEWYAETFAQVVERYATGKPLANAWQRGLYHQLKN